MLKSSPQRLLLTMVFTMSFLFAVWQVLLNNFVIETANFTGAEIGVLQSLREVPGFLAFTAVFVLLVLREQIFAYVALLVMGLGVALTGVFPSVLGLYFTTVLMSVGFHYFETINKSLTLQWLDKNETAHFMGRALSVKAVACLSAYGLIYITMELLNADYIWMYLFAGCLGVVVTVYIWGRFPLFDQAVSQKKRLVFKKRYWLYYTLVFLSGARRQIFIVFAGFMMVEKFGYSVGDISALFILNYVFNFIFAPKIGKIINIVGERRILIFEYIGLILVFTSYAFVTSAEMAAALYVIDHMFFAFAIAMHTYFQKIACKEDIAATASVSFTINHIAAVIIPAILGVLWLVSPKAVFLTGSAIACASLFFAFFIPGSPEPGNETATLFPVKSVLEP